MRGLPAFPVRLLALALCAFGFAFRRCETTSTGAEISGLQGKALIEAVEKMVPGYGETELPAADLLALLEKLAPESAGWKPQREFQDDNTSARS